jgi:HEAT repeat protein
MKKKIKESDEDKCLKILTGNDKHSQEIRTSVFTTLRDVAGAKALNFLCEGLKTKVFSKSWAIMKAIKILGDVSNDDSAVELLLSLAKEDEDLNVRIDAISEIGNIQEKLVKQKQIIRASLQKKIFSYFRRWLIGNKELDEDIRLSVVYTLADFKCEESIAILKQVLTEEEDIEKEIRLTVVSVLSGFKCEESIAILKQVLIEEEDRDIYNYACYSLFEIEPKKYSSVYYESIKRRKGYNYHKNDKTGRRLAAKSRNMLGEP